MQALRGNAPAGYREGLANVKNFQPHSNAPVSGPRHPLRLRARPSWALYTQPSRADGDVIDERGSIGGARYCAANSYAVDTIMNRQ